MMTDTQTTAQSRKAQALVWAVDDKAAEAALEHLHHSLWPYWYRFSITDVTHVQRGEPCPLGHDHGAVVAYAKRPRWTWVLVPEGSDFGPVLGATATETVRASRQPSELIAKRSDAQQGASTAGRVLVGSLNPPSFGRTGS